MTTPHHDPELDALLGAYALDALDGDERARVEAYIEQNADARREVDELRETAASLALAAADQLAAPAGLWSRISQAIGAGTRAAGDEVAARRRPRRGLSARWVGPLAAAAAIALVVLGAQVVSLHGQLDDARRTDARGLAAKFDEAWATTGARQVTLAPATGAEVARVALLPDGNGYLRNDGLPTLRAGRTYQLWVLMGDALHPVVISAGVLGADPRAVGFRTTGPVVGFAITAERAGGVVATQEQPIAKGSVV